MDSSRRHVLLSAMVSVMSAPVLANDIARSPSAPSLAEEVKKLVEDQFYDPDRAKQFGAEIAAKTESDLEAVRRGLAALRASHTALYTGADLDYYELIDIFLPILRKRSDTVLKEIFPPDGTPFYDGIGIATIRSGDGWHVSDIYDAGPAREADFKVGDLLVSADGQPFHPIHSFVGRGGTTATVTIRSSLRGPTREVRVKVDRFRPNALQDASIKSSVKTFKVDGTEIGYVRLWTHSTPESQKALQSLLSTEPLNRASALVVDLRCRHGGSPPQAAEIFVGASPQIEMIGRTGSIVNNFRYRKPVVGIIDGGTRSGMELFAYTLKKAGVPLVGSKTEGAVLGGTLFLLNDKSLLYLAVMDVKVDGQRLEGHGVTPTVPVAWDKLYSEGRDPQLSEAIRQASVLSR
jgi:carboxyl-terminal processing protease